MTDGLFRYLAISHYLTMVVESQNIKSTMINTQSQGYVGASSTSKCHWQCQRQTHLPRRIHEPGDMMAFVKEKKMRALNTASK